MIMKWKPNKPNYQMETQELGGDTGLPHSDGLLEIREKCREENIIHREHQREFLLRKARFSTEDQTLEYCSQKDIKILGKMLKNKNQVSCELLNTIMNTLLEDKEKITEFLQVDGALQALLRNLSGHNEKYQVISARCICNLALGSEKKSLQVLRASESYLMVHLSGKNKYITEACLVAIGNFSRQSLKHVELLKKQGFFSKIINLISDFDTFVQNAAIYAITQIIYKGFKIIESETFENCFAVVLPLFMENNTPAVAFLMSLLTAFKGIYKEPVIGIQICNHSLKNLCLAWEKKEKEVLFYLRIINNLICEEDGEIGKNLVQFYNCPFRESFKWLLHSEKQYLQKECLGLVGNLLNHPCQVFETFVMEILYENSDQVKNIISGLKKLPDEKI